MSTHQNAEIRHSGRVIRANVEVEAAVPVNGPSAGTAQWGGILRPPNNTGLERGELYTLVLPGCSPARIVITDEANPADGSVPFRGVGAVPLRLNS